jgi:hypothetical protein
MSRLTIATNEALLHCMDTKYIFSGFSVIGSSKFSFCPNSIIMDKGSPMEESFHLVQSGSTMGLRHCTETQHNDSWHDN